jgi:hypothetical protein
MERGCGPRPGAGLRPAEISNLLTPSRRLGPRSQARIGTNNPRGTANPQGAPQAAGRKRLRARGPEAPKGSPAPTGYSSVSGNDPVVLALSAAKVTLRRPLGHASTSGTHTG